MFYVIQTNKNRIDFQSRIIKVNDMSWEEFKTKIINQKENDPFFEINDSTMRGCILPKFTRIYEVPVNDEKHLEVKFKIWNGDDIVSYFYKVPKDHFEFVK
ncbi:hypothetical protein [Clostridium perfringens]|jgi:hypothetical protein|uniref:Uncharacterized protein n=1 Tax=Clostridium perfringens TaxID=1502 RepID=A0AAW4J675_CLOPF|nr:hypothetical protein [Clostridium perfringens]MBO3356142.1 hypothetical protein [Clostridium perfringens]MBO3359517.1 hypothetical protein [Clostridium perfringens]